MFIFLLKRNCKTELTINFMKRKMKEYDELKAEIEEEVNNCVDNNKNR